MKLYKFTYTAVLAMPSYMEVKDLKYLGVGLAEELQKKNDNTIVLDGHKTILEKLDEITIS